MASPHPDAARQLTTSSEPARMVSDGTLSNLYAEMENNNDNYQEGVTVGTPNNRNFSDMYNQMAEEIEEHLRLDGEDDVQPVAVRSPGLAAPQLEHRVSTILDESTALRDVATPAPDSNIMITAPPYDEDAAAHDVRAEDGEYLDRPATAASGDTYHKAQTLFTDFDGAHYPTSIAPSIRAPSIKERPRRASGASFFRPQSMMVPPPEAGMAFYPAPVPQNLNLPQRLSTANPAQAKRRSQMLSTFTADARKSAIWMNGHGPSQSVDTAVSEEETRKAQARMSALPPQLRASMFFETPSVMKDVEVKEKSVNKTFDDLLDSSTTAPVSAFTDHPFAGRKAGNVYKRTPEQRRSMLPKVEVPQPESEPEPEPELEPLEPPNRRSIFGWTRRFSMASTTALGETGSKLKRRNSSALSLGAKLDDAALARDADGNIVGGLSDGASQALQDDDEEIDGDFPMPEDEDEEQFIGPPTTLLAELQYRKEQQKLRKVTAVTAFPNGMHSTLLQLDEVAQIQKKRRQNARVTLAWEDPNAKPQNPEDEDDDDVPLGEVLARKMGKENNRHSMMPDFDQPIGLLQMREMEDNEPLAARKARLQAALYPPRELSPSRSYAQSAFGGLAPSVQLNGHDFDEGPYDADEDEEETLAQRAQRLREKHEEKEFAEEIDEDTGRPMSQAFTDELLGFIDGHSSNGQSPAADDRSNISSQPLRGATPDEEEETLGQRRERLLRLQQQADARPNTAGAFPVPEQLPQRPPNVRASTSLADLLHHMPLGATNKMSNKQFTNTLAPTSLLGRNEAALTARKEQIRQASSGTINRPLMDFAPDGINMNNARNSVYGMQPNAAGRASVMDFNSAQSNYAFGGMQQPQPQPAMDPNAYTLQQQQALLYQMSMVNNMMINGMGASPYGASPYGAAPFDGIAASTPNLLSGAGAPPISTPYMQHQRQSSMFGMTAPGPQTPGGVSAGAAVPHPHQQVPTVLAGSEGFLDTKTRSRIDAWRQDVEAE